MMNEVKLFNNEELGFNINVKMNEDGDVLAKVHDVAVGLGFTQIKGGKLYVKYERVNKYLQGFGVSPLVGKDDYIPESMIYLLAMKANNDVAIKFQMWLATEVIPDVRRNGMFISNTATTEQKEYNYNMLDVTFGNCSIELLKEKYEECMRFHAENKTRIPYAKNSKKRADARHSHSDSKIKIMNRVVQVLETRNGKLIDDGRFGLISEVNDVIKVIKDDINKQYNKSSGAKIAGKTKKIKELECRIEGLCPPIDKFVCVDYHAWSVNKMYTYSGGKTVRTNGYKTWIDRFPKNQIPDIGYWDGVDFTKPTRLIMKFVVADNRLDADNLSKSFADMVFNRLYSIDDNIVVSRESTIIDTCEKYSNGKIYFYIQNI